MQVKKARRLAIAALRARGFKVSPSAGRIGVARMLGLSVPPFDKAAAGRALVAYFSKPENKVRRDFYHSREWREVRYKALLRSDGRCECCGSGKAQGAVLHVDHIKPRSKFPSMELALENLQVLCLDCNKGKSNTDQTDWRHSRVASEFSEAAAARKLRLVIG